MSRHRIGLSRMQGWSEPFIGDTARDLHRLEGDGYFDFSSEYRANLHGFNRVGSFGFVPESTNEMYLRPINCDPVDIDLVEFYNGLSEEDFERERRINWNGRCTESGRSGNGYFVSIESPLTGRTQIRRFEPLSTPEFDSLVERIRSFYR